MVKRILTAFVLPLLLLFGPIAIGSSNAEKSAASQAVSGTLQRMIAENGSITMDLDLNGLNGNGSLVARPVRLNFAVFFRNWSGREDLNLRPPRSRTELHHADFRMIS